MLSEYNPWISGVMIFDQHRGKGNGIKLISAAKEELKKIKYDKAPSFYKNRDLNI